ncbi:uncharacterized protein [Littorina saxatilis]|uniref:CDP-diacylglycerol--inositol 3-phosphatidyltransferase n=1 Tax=Littorina saxatilis TaxID=31220 RepID=A0AAN9AI26_9CAEN
MSLRNSYVDNAQRCCAVQASGVKVKGHVFRPSAIVREGGLSRPGVTTSHPEDVYWLQTDMEKVHVLLYVPNIIGYMRVILTILAFVFYEQPLWFIILYSASIALDGVDGYAARKLNQCSDFGAWFDVVIDVFSRGLLWCSLHEYGYLVIFVEWLTFVSTHCRGPKWKIPEESFPWLVKSVMGNNFKTFWGTAAITGLNVLPLWLYGYRTGYLATGLSVPLWGQLLGIAVLTVGRTVCMFVECFFIYSHVMRLLDEGPTRQQS